MTANEASRIIDRASYVAGEGGGGHYPRSTQDEYRYISRPNILRLLEYQKYITQLANTRNKHTASDSTMRVHMLYPTMHVPQLLNMLGISLNNAMQVLNAAGRNPNGLNIENRNRINMHRIHITADQYDILSNREEDIRTYARNQQILRNQPPQNLSLNTPPNSNYPL